MDEFAYQTNSAARNVQSEGLLTFRHPGLDQQGAGNHLFRRQGLISKVLVFKDAASKQWISKVLVLWHFYLTLRDQQGQGSLPSGV